MVRRCTGGRDDQEKSGAAEHTLRPLMIQGQAERTVEYGAET
jgi:hypothetical protein